MKAVVWHGRHDVRVEDVPDPKILNPRDCIVRVTSTALCGSDLHLYDKHVPTVHKGDILGHEFMGEVVEVGSAVGNLTPGDRVVVPAPIACGRCWFCREGLTALCDNSNPNSDLAERAYGFSGAAIFGYSHLFGGYPGGQAEYVRVPFADFGPVKVPGHLSDEQVLFLSDILPTGWAAAENCGIRPGDVVAVFGCGPVGQFALEAARLLGAAKVIALDAVDERLHLAAQGGAETVNIEDATNLVEELKHRTGGRGPDACIDAVGMESQGNTTDAFIDWAKQTVHLETDRPGALRVAIQACRKGGTVSVAGLYGGMVDNFPLGSVFAKGLTLRSGQTHVHRLMRPLLERIEKGEIAPERIITHRIPLADATEAYRLFSRREGGCMKVVLNP